MNDDGSKRSTQKSRELDDQLYKEAFNKGTVFGIMIGAGGAIVIVYLSIALWMRFHR